MMALTRLDNGLTVVTDRMPHVDSAALGVWIEAGARTELVDEHGIAHFLEHMAFKGTRRRSARAISEAIEDVGGDINAATSVETTAYHARVLAEDVPLALDILADILTDPLFAEADIVRERNVILQEIGAAEDVPEDRAFDAFPETAFRAQPLGRRILGSRASVTGIGEARLRDFFGRHYRTGAMTVAAAGAIDHDAFVTAVADAFAAMPEGAADKGERAQYTGGAYSEASHSSECQWLLGFEGVPAAADEAVVAQLAAMVLGGGMSSRLFQSLREDRGLVYDTSAFHWAFADSGLFAIHFATEPATLGEAADVVADELAAARQSITPAELARAKAQLRAGLLMSRESCAARMTTVARNAMIHGRLVSKEERIEMLERVSVADIGAFFGKLNLSPPTLVSVGAKDDTSLEAVRARFEGTALRGAA